MNRGWCRKTRLREQVDEALFALVLLVQASVVGAGRGEDAHEPPLREEADVLPVEEPFDSEGGGVNPHVVIR